LVANLDELLELRERDLGVFKSQSYELKGATGGGSQVALEVLWRGRVGATQGPFLAGQDLEARSAIFLRFQDGRIARQHVFTCFEPWSTESERAVELAERASALRAQPVAESWALKVPFSPVAGSNFAIARQYLEALNSGAAPEAIAAFYEGHAVQDEFPNRLLPRGATRHLPEISEARARRRALLNSERFDLRGATGGGSQVAMEIRWTGLVRAPIGPFLAGQTIAGRSALFLRFEGGLIVRQRNYDCF
jgi:ketosteroid isomerase-like protein